MSRDLFFRLHNVLTKAVDDQIFPGACIGVVKNDGLNNTKYYYSYGYTDYSNSTSVNHHTYYDLASLTKPLATTLAILALIKSNKLTFDDKLSSFFGDIADSEKNKIRLLNLLNHNSGLQPYHEFYKELLDNPISKRIDILKQLILALPLSNPVGEKQVYSDLGYMLLGMIVAIQSGWPLNDFVAKMIYHPLAVENDLFFINTTLPPTVSATRGIAPTERCPWRQRVVCGAVHDDNAAVLGGVAGHAGLFGNVTGVLDLVTFLLDVVNGRRQHPHINSRDLRLAVTRQNQQGSWGLGFDTPTQGSSSSGRYFSATSFGHLGFTGTSFWADPQHDVAVVVLSNRVHPDRQNNKIREFRPLVHDTIMELLVGGG